MTSDKNIDPRSQLPAVSDLLQEKPIQNLIDEFSRQETLNAINLTLQDFREMLENGENYPGHEKIISVIKANMDRMHRQDLKIVVNATGIILHTGLGRAVLPERASQALAELNHPCNLQIDLENGKRGKRHYRTEQLLCQITGAEAAHIVNNNAAATLLILATFCNGKEVIISRGQMIEIGGSYRLPDCIHQSGAKMVEVGTTNKTHLYDYEQALTEETAAILHVNPSNYHIQGFSEQVSINKLADLKKEQSFILIDDLGCGALVDMRELGLPYEPTAGDSIEAGADLVCFSGDKLIGGPQAGIIVGKEKLIQKIKDHPLSRMLRAGKLTDMALEKTLRLFLEKEKLSETNPTYSMLAKKKKDIEARINSLLNRLMKLDLNLDIEIVDCESAVGGGSMPQASLPSKGLALKSKSASLQRVSNMLREFSTPVLSYIENDRVILDFRTVLDSKEENMIIETIQYVSNKINDDHFSDTN